MIYIFQYTGLACPLLNIFRYILLFSSFLSQIVWVFYILVPVCEQKKSEFLPTWMLFVLFFLPNCSCQSFSRAVRDSGKASVCPSEEPHASSGVSPAKPRKLFSQCPVKGHPMKWAGQGAAWLLLSLRCAALGLHSTGCIPARIPLSMLLDSAHWALCTVFTPVLVSLSFSVC